MQNATTVGRSDQVHLLSVALVSALLRFGIWQRFLFINVHGITFLRSSVSE